MYIKCHFIICFISLILTEMLYSQQYLSDLNAGKDDPIYTTYAAPLNRSEFIVDEGYTFKWYDLQDGIDFETNNGGSLCIGFKLNGEFRYYLNEFYTEPLITTSYSDLVKYYYYPFEGIRVEIFFDVYSSRIAIQDINITNESGSDAELTVYPFFYHQTDEITDVSIITPEYDGFIFQHKERPDSWTISHEVPYQEDLINVYLIDSEADAFGAYTYLSDPSFPMINKQGSNYCVEWGTVNHKDGSSCLHAPPNAQMIVLHNNSDIEILTEDAPKWGDPDPNIPGNGYQGCELGNFQNPSIAAGDSFTIIFNCLVTGQQGIGKGLIPTLPSSGGVRTDIQLTEDEHPPVPANAAITFSQDYTSAELLWQQVEYCTYSIYRRCGEPEGRFDLIIEGLESEGYLDTDLDPDNSYNYIIIARDDSDRFSGHSKELGRESGQNIAFFSDILYAQLYNTIPAADVKITAMQKKLSIPSGQSSQIHIIRGVGEAGSNVNELIAECRNSTSIDLQLLVGDAEQIYSQIPNLTFSNPDYEMLYWSAFSLVRQCMMPPEGECSYNYYIFSREPTWGWGHGGQVFHESLVMLAYAFMDGQGAMNSQRVYMERQWSDGYINYRTGPYLNETIPFNDQYTTSAPLLNWENWEIYKITEDTLFLQEAYQSGSKFYQYWLDNRNADGDSLCEWGAHAVLESLRDGWVAVWDQVGWPANFECMDLNVMLVSEAHSLAQMALELGNTNEYDSWINEAAKRTEAINNTFWDEQTNFFYHVDKNDHDFTYNSANDLKRQEIIGFLPLWANSATTDQAEKLVQVLTDPTKFWRTYGIPTLASDDSYYNPKGYWNGPVWVQWQYLIFRGLINYGYHDQAKQLANKVLIAVIEQLKKNHNFWELYSPEDQWAGYHKTYIWTAIVARMMIDLKELETGLPNAISQMIPETVFLKQNYPNPFNPFTVIGFELPQAMDIEINVYNVLGQKIRTLINSVIKPGSHIITWNGMDDRGNHVASGIYLYRLQADKFLQTRKMLLVR